MTIKKLKVGDVIKITDESKIATLKNFFEDEMDAQMAFRMASRICRKASDELWKTLREMYPETEQFNCVLDFEKNEIIIKGQK